MIYKNARIYRNTDANRLIISTSELEAFAFQPCGPCQPKSYGFVPPFEGGTDLVHEADGTWLLCLQIQERMLPPAVINKALAEEVARIESEQGRKVYRKERQQMRDEVIVRLLPQAFTRDKRVLGHFDHKAGLLIIDTASTSTAELFINQLREAIGSPPVILLQPTKAPPRQLASVIERQHYSGRIRASLEAKLADAEGAGTITIKNEDLDSDEVRAHLDAGMLPQEVRIDMHEMARFTLTDDLSIKRIRLDAALIHNASGDLEDRARLDADYYLNVQTLREIYQEMRQLFGIDIEPGREDELRASALDTARRALARHEAQETFTIPEDTVITTANDEGLESLYSQAVEHVRESGKASIVNLQRGCRLGYNMAARMLERMEIEGIVSPISNQGQRTVNETAAPAA